MIASTASHFTPRGDRRGRRRRRRAGSSSTGPTTASWSRASSTAPSAAGYGAIVAHRRHLRPRLEAARPAAGLAAFLNGMGIANYFQDPVFRAGLEQTPEEDHGAATGHFLGVQANPALTWDDLAWLRELTSLPILVKGIQHVDDAREAARAASTASSSPTTAAARSTARSPRSTRCRRSPPRSATSSRSSSTAASAAAPTCSRRWRSAPTRSASAAPTSGAWRWTARPGSKRC